MHKIITGLILLSIFVNAAEDCMPFGVRTSFGKQYFDSKSAQLFNIKFNTNSQCNQSFVLLSQQTRNQSLICSTQQLIIVNKTTFTTYIHSCSVEGFIAGKDITYGVYGVDSNKKSYKFQNKDFLIYMVDQNKNELNQFIFLADWGPIKTQPYTSLTDSFNTLLNKNRTSIHGIIVNGDIAYDLDSNGCQNYVDFLNMIPQVTTAWPIIFSTGNHQYNSANNWNLYTKSFQLYNQTIHYLQSFIFKNVQILQFDPFAVVSGKASQAQVDQYYANIKNQLVATKGRTAWRVAGSHYPLFCSEGSKNCTKNNASLATLWNNFNDQSMDVYIGAHTHIYERGYPYYKGTILPVQGPYLNIDSMVSIVQGVAGNDDHIVETTYKLQSFTAKATFNQTGFGILSIHNATTLEYTHYSTKGGMHIADNVKIQKSMAIEKIEQGMGNLRKIIEQ